MQNIYKEINDFLGIKNDEDKKEIDPKYFWNAKNFNFQTVGLSGMEKITMPARVNYIADIPNAETWSQTEITEGSELILDTSITFDGEKFIVLENLQISAGLYYCKIKYSSDGKLWEEYPLSRTLTDTKRLYSIAYGNGVYIIVGSDSLGANKSILYSTDLITWTEIVAPNGYSYSKVRFLNDKFIAISESLGANTIIYSFDGLSWSEVNTGITGNWYDISFGLNKYVIVGRVVVSGNYYSKIIYSSDLITWSSAYQDTLSSAGLFGICYGGQKFIACGGSALKGQLYISTDGINWTDIHLNLPANQEWEKITYGNGIYVMSSISGYKTFATSEDGYVWQGIELVNSGVTPKPLWGYDIIYANRIFISVGTTYIYDGATYIRQDGVIMTNGNNEEANIDGLFEYRYLDSNNKLQVEQIGVCNGKIYKDILSIPKIISTDISKGKCSFAVLNDCLYIANGKDYVWKYDGAKGVITQMGAPTANKNGLGVLNGKYYYAITNVLAGGEEYVGSVSNSLDLNNNKVLLDIPIGYSGTLSRKIYRTEANGTTLKLLATIADNTTLTYSDNNLDDTLGANIINVNNDLPKPYFISVYNERLVGAKVDLYPTQIFISDVEIDFFDLGSNGLDIANYSDDNSPVNGIGIDFSNLMVATLKHWYLITIDSSGNFNVTTTRVNIGCKDGYSIVRVPTYGDFSGGLMFVSTNNDVRVTNGLRAIPVSTSVDNIYSDMFSQNIMGTLHDALNGYSNVYSLYYDYKYHLIIDGNKYVYDIRLKGWTYHEIQTEDFKSSPICLAIFDDILYNGQEDGWIEQEYFDTTYRGQEVTATLESVELNVSKDYSAFQKLVFWLSPNEYNKMALTVIADDDVYYAENKEFDFLSGAYDYRDFSPTEFTISGETDFKTFNIYKPVRWLRWILNVTEGSMILRKWGMYLQTMTGKE